MRADVHRFSLSDPSDVSGLRRALDLGAIDPTTIVAVIGKTHGNGLVNDYTRGYLTLCLSLLIGEQLGESAEDVRARIPFVFSGGVEGVLSPHYTVFTAIPEDEPAAGSSLAIGVAFTAPMRAADVGRQAQIDAVAEAVSRARQQAGIAAKDVHFVQVKGPAFTLSDILEDQAAGRSVATDVPGKLMSFGRAACALGVAAALGEIPAERAVEAAVLKDVSLYSSVASMSAGVEVRTNEVIVLGMSPHWSGPLAIEHGTMVDALDVGSVHALVQRSAFRRHRRSRNRGASARVSSNARRRAMAWCAAARTPCSMTATSTTNAISAPPSAPSWPASSTIPPSSSRAGRSIRGPTAAASSPSSPSGRPERMSKPRVVVVGAGIAGSLILAGLAGRDDIDLICLERVGPDDHAEAGTGLNIGPNAMKCLAAHLPESAAAIVANSLPWAHWQISLTDGRVLMDLPLAEVADNPGIRIRWAELYSLLRRPIADRIIFNAELTGCKRGPAVTWRDRAAGKTHDIADIDLLIAGDGRYSLIRSHVFGAPEVPHFHGVCLYRLLFPVGEDCPIDDYGQWFNGPNRLLAFRVPGDFVYCAGSFPIPPDSGIPEEMKTADFLGRIYRPDHGEPSPPGRFPHRRGDPPRRQHPLGAAATGQRRLWAGARRAAGGRQRAPDGADARARRDPGLRGCLRRRRGNPARLGCRPPPRDGLGAGRGAAVGARPFRRRCLL